ncbi:MAG: hypothetical protein IKI16_06870 [Prevotella sp.]|nr:hypothetical protein [Prevotella sp.]
MKVKNLLGITGLSTLVLLFVVAAFTSFSSDDEFAETIAPQQKMIPFSTTIGAKSNEGSTRAVSEEGVTTWVVGEEIAMVVSTQNGDKLYKATVTEVAANGIATVTGAVYEETADGSAVNLIYPYSAVDEDTKAIKADLLKAQRGTIADLSANYDVATANGTLSVNSTSATLKEQVTLANQNGICKFQFQDKGNGNVDITGIERLVIKDNSNNLLSTAFLPDAANSVWVAMAPITTTSKVNFEVATSDGKTYVGNANAKVEASKKYILTLKVTEADYVDLGIVVNSKRILWAKKNVGAANEGYYGDYFAWGEVTPKTDYSWSTYAWVSSHTTLTKYNTKAAHGTVDNKEVLDPEDDAAHVNMGCDWYMPTRDELNALSATKSNTTDYTWEWTTADGHNGYRITQNSTGNNIFLPAAGYFYGAATLYDAGTGGYYWSSSLYTDYPHLAWYLNFLSDNAYMNYDIYRYYGHSVRGVQRN